MNSITTLTLVALVTTGLAFSRNPLAKPAAPLEPPPQPSEQVAEPLTAHHVKMVAS
jgi:hypothetical protein